MKNNGIVCAGGLVAALVASGYGGEVIAQGALRLGGDTANFGVHRVNPGFVPDPMNVDVVSGGNLDARELHIGPGCIGWVTRQPDVIVQLSAPSDSLRFYVTANGTDDTTLIVNHANGSWRCSDDSWGTLSPTVDLPRAIPGRYSVWIGSYRSGVQAHGTLHITELASNHP